MIGYCYFGQIQPVMDSGGEEIMDIKNSSSTKKEFSSTLQPKAFLRTRQPCPKCNHHKLRQLVVIRPVMSASVSYFYDFCEWCYYKVNHEGLYKGGR